MIWREWPQMTVLIWNAARIWKPREKCSAVPMCNLGARSSGQGYCARMVSWKTRYCWNGSTMTRRLPERWKQQSGRRCAQKV